MQCSCKQGSYADVTVPEANGVLHSDTNVLTVNPGHLLHWLLMLWWPAQNSQYPQPDPDMQGRSVLLAEDNLINQRVAKMMLCSLGMCCEVASNGREAVDAVLRRIGREDIRQFDVLLMDMAMPVMGGVDATKVCCCLFASQCSELPDVQTSAGELLRGRYSYPMALAVECCVPCEQ